MSEINLNEYGEDSLRLFDSSASIMSFFADNGVFLGLIIGAVVVIFLILFLFVVFFKKFKNIFGELLGGFIN